MDNKSVTAPTFGDPAVPGAVWQRLTQASDGCWLWQGSTTSKGYGLTAAAREAPNKPAYVHRLVFTRLVGPIAEGMELDHLCRTRACANPAHLDPVTHRENVLRSPTAPAAINARKTHCKRGHPFGQPYEPGKRRSCGTCIKAYRRTYKRVSTPEWRAYRLEWNRAKRARLRAEEAAGRVLTHAELIVLGRVKKGSKR